MKVHKGSALVQYAIILSCVSVVVIGIYSVFGQQLNQFFNKYLSVFTGNNTAVAANAKLASNGASSNTQVKIYNSTPGPLGGTPDNPISQCESSSCDIDFGSFMLKGVPENFGEFVASNGTSGGVDSLSSLIMQVADQVESTDPATASEIRDLANLGHFIADVVNINEAKTKELEALYPTNKSYQVGNYSSFLQSYVDVPLPDNISHLLPNYSTSLSIRDQLMYASPLTYNSATYDTKMPGQAFNTLLNKINSSNLTPEQISVVQKLSDNIKEIVLNHTTTTTGLQTAIQNITTASEANQMSLDTIYAPKTSLGTDVRSALICTTGKNYDNGNECNK